MSLSRIASISTALLLSACAYVPFSGGKLEGTPTAPLKDWRQIAAVDIIQLETQPTDPYSVKLWMIAKPTHLYVYAGDNHSQWAQNIDSDPNVRLLVDGALYDLSATRVLDQAEFQQFTAAWLEKYDSDRTDLNVADTYLYRLEPRS